MTNIFVCIILCFVCALWCFGMGLRRGKILGIRTSKKRLLDEIYKGSIKHAYSQPEILLQPRVTTVEDRDGFCFEITARFLERRYIGDTTRTEDYIIITR